MIEVEEYEGIGGITASPFRPILLFAKVATPSFPKSYSNRSSSCEQAEKPPNNTAITGNAYIAFIFFMRFIFKNKLKYRDKYRQ